MVLQNYLKLELNKYMATALEKFTNLATGNVTTEEIYGQSGIMSETLTDVNPVPIEEESPLDLASETEKQVKIASMEEDQVDDIAPAVAGVNAQLQAFSDSQETTDTTPVTDRTALTDTLTSELEQLTGKSGRLLEERDEQVGNQEQQLADLNTQIASLSAEFDELTSAQEGRGRTKIFTSGRQAQIQRQKAVVIGGKATLALALQGNIDAARAKAQETVDLEFGALEQSIANTRELLEINEPEYTAAQNKEAAKLKAQLDERTRLINEEKETKNNIYNIAITALQNGADNTSVQAILESEDYGKAIGIAGKFLSPQQISEIQTEISGFQGGAGVVGSPNGEYYDITSYATDPTHETKIQSIMDSMGKMGSVADMDSYIQSVAPGSEVTGKMIANASEKYGVSWEIMMAIMQQDSSFGTAGIGARNFNPGNVGQFDSLGTTPTAGYSTWQEGVDAVAENLSRRKSTAPMTNPEVSSYVNLVQTGQLTAKQAFDEVSSENKQALTVALATTPNPQDTQQDQIAKDKANLALELKTHNGLDSAVGPFRAARTMFSIQDRFGATDVFIGKVEQLISDLSLESLIEAKSRGATFGALSENEMRILSSAATTLGAWRKTNDKGNVWFETTEKAFKDELDNISKIFTRAIKSTEANEEFSASDPLGLGI